MKYTVPLSRNHEFRRLYSKGKSAASQSMIVYCRKNGRLKNGGRIGGKGEVVAPNRVGFTVSTKLGNAVRRNRIRRRLREVYRLFEDGVEVGYDIVIVARSPAFDTPFSQLQGEFAKNCRRIGIIKAHQTAAAVSNKPQNGERSNENRSAKAY